MFVCDGSRKIMEGDWIVRKVSDGMQLWFGVLGLECEFFVIFRELV